MRLGEKVCLANEKTGHENVTAGWSWHARRHRLPRSLLQSIGEFGGFKRLLAEPLFCE